MLNHLQTIIWSAHWRSQESQSNFLMHSTRQPPMHSTLTSCPRWNTSDPPENSNLALQGTDLPPWQRPLSQHPPSVILAPTRILHACLLSKSHSNSVVLEVWSAEFPHRDHKGECWNANSQALAQTYCTAPSTGLGKPTYWSASCLPQILILILMHANHSSDPESFAFLSQTSLSPCFSSPTSLLITHKNSQKEHDDDSNSLWSSPKSLLSAQRHSLNSFPWADSGYFKFHPSPLPL